MSTTPVSQHPSDLPRRVLSLLSAASAACLAMMLALLAFALTTRVVFTERALPGVTAAGVDLSGMNAEQIRQALQMAITYPSTGAVVLTDQGRVWVATPAEIGVSIDGEAVASRALAVGRDGGLQTRLADQSHAWVEGDDIPVALVFDHATASGYLERLAAEIDTPPVEASLALEGLTVRSSPGAMGRQVDILAALRALEPPISRMQDVGLAMPIRETAPQVLDASATAERTQRVLSQEFILDAGDGQSWSLSPTELAAMLEFIVVENPGGAAFEAKLRADDLLLMLEELAPDLERTPQNARFIFNDETRQLDLLTEAVTGRRLDIEATVEAIEEAINRGESKSGSDLRPRGARGAQRRHCRAARHHRERRDGGHLFRRVERRAYSEYPHCRRRFPRAVDPSRRDGLDGRTPWRHQPGHRLHRSTDHLRKSHDQGRRGRRLSGQHNVVSGGLLRRLPHRRAQPTRLPRAVLRAGPELPRPRHGCHCLCATRRFQVHQRHPTTGS